METPPLSRTHFRSNPVLMASLGANVGPSELSGVTVHCLGSDKVSSGDYQPAYEIDRAVGNHNIRDPNWGGTFNNIK